MSNVVASDDLAIAGQLRARRRLVLGGFALALLLLIVGMAVFVIAHRQARLADVTLRQATQSLAEARHQKDMANQQSKLHAAMQQLATRAEALGLGPDQWSERRVNLHQQPVDRAMADNILTSTGRGNGHLFAAKTFDLSVVNAKEGLFQLPPDNNQPLRMTMSGTALFSTREHH